MFVSVYIDSGGEVTVTNHETEAVTVFEAGSPQAEAVANALSEVAH